MHFEKARVETSLGIVTFQTERLLSPELNHRHRTILELLDKYPKDFEELNPLTVETELGYNNLRDFTVVFGIIKPSRNSQY